MKLTKEKMIRAAKAFNQAKSFTEFKILLDLVDVVLEDFEYDYYELAAMHPIFASIIPCDKKNKRFNSKMYMAIHPKDIPGLVKIKYRQLKDKFSLPIWIEKDRFGRVELLLPNNEKAKLMSYSPELANAMSKFGIDSTKEMGFAMLYELGTE